MTLPHAGSHNNERIARAALSWLTEPGDLSLHLVAGSAGPVLTLQAVADQVFQPSLRAELRIRRDVPERCRAHHVSEALEHVEDALSRGIGVRIPSDPDWPTDVTGPDAPVCLWTRGPAPVPPPSRAVAIVGTKNGTAYGRHLASELGYGLAEHEFTVITSGTGSIARAALSGALAHDAHPVALLCGGLDQSPLADGRDWERLAADSLLLSAWPPDALPNPDRRAANWRLLARLVSGAVLVEATRGDPVQRVLHDVLDLSGVAMAVPGPVTSAFSAGCHQLLRDEPRVRLVTNADDVLAALRDAGV